MVLDPTFDVIAIAVEFAGPLAYDRSYEIAVSGVRAPGQSSTATLRAEVRTGSTDVLALVPSGSDGGKDRIVRRSLDAGGATTVYADTGITEFTRLGRSLVVVRDAGRGASAVDVVPLTGGVQDDTVPVEHLTLPTSAGRVTALHAADDGASFGFEYADTSSGRSADVGLYVVDMTGTHMPTAIAADGKPTTGAVPMTVGQWAYVPRTESALVRTSGDDLVLVDMSGAAAAVRLGSATTLHGFVGSGTTAVVETGTGIEYLDLTDGARTPVATPAGEVGAWADLLAAAAVGTLATGRSAVVVVPDHRDQAQIERALASRVDAAVVIRDDARQTGPARYAGFLRMLSEAPCIVVGNQNEGWLRSGVFAVAHRGSLADRPTGVGSRWGTVGGREKEKAKQMPEVARRGNMRRILFQENDL